MRKPKKKPVLLPRQRMCPTCPFRPDGWTELRGLLEERAMCSTPICHSTGRALKRIKGERPQPAMACRGARNRQIEYFFSIGFLAEPTDACWAAKLAELEAQQ